MCYGFDNQPSDSNCLYCISNILIDEKCIKYNSDGCLECILNYIIHNF